VKACEVSADADATPAIGATGVEAVVLSSGASEFVAGAVLVFLRLPVEAPEFAGSTSSSEPEPLLVSLAAVVFSAREVVVARRGRVEPDWA